MSAVVDFLKKFEVHSTFILIFLALIVQFGAQEENVVGNEDSMPALVGVDFEVFGRVQGVFFRKYTESRAKELGLKGWCMNTQQGTVLGYVEGDKPKIEEMKHWLRSTGSPQSEIDKAEFRNEKDLAAPTQEKFSIKK